MVSVVLNMEVIGGIGKISYLDARTSGVGVLCATLIIISLVS